MGCEVGWEPYRTWYQGHLNGNAIYKAGDRCFRRYRELVRDEYGDAAFDVAMTYYRMSLKRIMVLKNVASRFQVTDVIAHLGVTRFDEDEVRRRFPTAYLVHGKFMHVKRPWLNFMQYR